MDEISCRKFLVCHTVWQYGDTPEPVYSLGRLVVKVWPNDAGYPIRLDRLFVYAELLGESDDCSLHVRLARIEPSGYDEEVEYPIWRWRDFRVRIEDSFVECIVTSLPKVQIPISGLYEFQLWLSGELEPIARERILASE